MQDAKALTVEAVNFAAQTAFMSDGTCVAIVGWYAAGGDDCEPDDARSAVTAEAADGLYHVIDLADYSPPMLN
jgi:hypothetical protein